MLGIVAVGVVGESRIIFRALMYRAHGGILRGHLCDSTAFLFVIVLLLSYGENNDQILYVLLVRLGILCWCAVKKLLRRLPASQIRLDPSTTVRVTNSSID